MPGFRIQGGVIEGQAEVVELVSTGEGGEESFEFEITEDTEALLVVTEGDGGASLSLNQAEVGELFSDTTLSIVREGRLEAYVDTAPRAGAGRLTLWYQSGRTFTGRVIRFTRGPARWIRQQILNHGACWTCKQIIRSLLNAVGGLVGIPDIPLLDEVFGDGGEALERLVGVHENLPRPLRELLERFFGPDWTEILLRIIRAIGQGPFGWITNSVCEQLGYCP